MANLGEMWKQKSQSHGSYGKCLDTTRPGEQHRVAPPEVPKKRKGEKVLSEDEQRQYGEDRLSCFIFVLNK